MSIHKLIHPVLLKLSKSKMEYELRVINTYDMHSEEPVIFAVNHTNSSDIPMVCNAIKRHSYLLIGKQNLYLSDRLFFILNGTIWVDRKNRSDMKKAKEKIIKLLKNRRGKNAIIWFPEGTWNMSDNLLMLPMKWGIIDVAKQTKASIIPVILDYDRQGKSCKAVFGNEITTEGIDKSIAIRNLRDEMATIRWNLWEENNIVSRNDVDVQSERKLILDYVDEYPPLDLEYEMSVIFQQKEVV